MTSLYNKLSEERKKLQAEGLCPEWFTTAGWQMFKEKYLYQADNPKEQYERIARTLACHTENPSEWKEKFFNLLWKGWLSPSTPVLANTGTSRGLPVSCSGTYISDDLGDIYKAKHEVAMLTKHGFGTASYLGDIRSRGSEISVGGKAMGVMPIIQGFQTDMEYVSQGAARRGSWAGYLPIDHGDFDEVCTYLEQNPDGNNIGWVISNDFIGKLSSGDEEAVRRYSKSLVTKMVTGKGYYFFVDKANEKRPEWYKEKDLDIKSSQLCVTGDQLVVSSRGIKTALDLYNEGGDLELFDNEGLVKASPMKKIEENSDVFRITLANGMEHTVTSYHKVKTERGMVAVSELNENDRVYFQTNEGLFGSVDMEDEAFLLGLYQADGTQNNGRIFINLWENDFDLIDEVKQRFDLVYDKHNFGENNFGSRKYPKPSFVDCFACESVTGNKVPKKSLGSVGLSRDLGFEKGVIPDWILQGTKETQWQYVRGLFVADGTVNVSGGKGNPLYLSITNTDKTFLKKLQIVLSNLGCKFALHLSSEEGCKKLPNGKGGYDEYWCKNSYRLVCGNKPDAIHFEKNTGFLNRKGVVLENRDYRDNTKKCSKVVSVEYIGKEDVYCVTVDSEDHLWVCNGIITSNCSEIMLHSSEDYTYTCVLSSMNASKYDEWKDTEAVFEATVFLDCVAQEFIERAKNIKGLEKAVAFTKKSRALGLGVCGFHTYLQSRMIPFESMEAMFINDEIFRKLDEDSKRASAYCAQLWGEPEWMKGWGYANSHRLAVAPTKSTSLIMGGISEGINPDTAMVYTQRTPAGEVDRVNPVLLKIMKEKGVYNKANIEEVRYAMGSVQSVSWLTDEEKAALKTAFEINQKSVITLASQRAKYLDQWQSLNLFFAAGEDASYINEVHKMAFLDPEILALYYVYSKAGVQASKDECVACQ